MSLSHPPRRSIKAPTRATSIASNSKPSCRFARQSVIEKSTSRTKIEIGDMSYAHHYKHDLQKIESATECPKWAWCCYLLNPICLQASNTRYLWPESALGGNSSVNRVEVGRIEFVGCKLQSLCQAPFITVTFQYKHD